MIRTITDPWKPGIVLLLWLRASSFTDLVHALHISRSTLSQRLRQLMDDGCVEQTRTGDGEPGGRAAYRLTSKGADLLAIVLLNRQWNARWGGGNHLLPQLKLAHACGAPLRLQMVCRHCGAEVRAREVKVLQTAAQPLPDAQAAPATAYRRTRRQTADAAGMPMRGEIFFGDRWTALVQAAAFHGLRRNLEIEQAIDAAPNVLADRLSSLTEHGLLERRPYQSAPERHAYRLTEKGLDRYPVILAMMQWADRWLEPRAPSGWNLLHKPCHEWLSPRLACQACHGDADGASIRVG